MEELLFSSIRCSHHTHGVYKIELIYQNEWNGMFFFSFVRNTGTKFEEQGLCNVFDISQLQDRNKGEICTVIDILVYSQTTRVLSDITISSFSNHLMYFLHIVCTVHLPTNLREWTSRKFGVEPSGQHMYLSFN